MSLACTEYSSKCDLLQNRYRYSHKFVKSNSKSWEICITIHIFDFLFLLVDHNLKSSTQSIKRPRAFSAQCSIHSAYGFGKLWLKVSFILYLFSQTAL